jgi:type VI secretion system secreted protein Hcp
MNVKRISLLLAGALVICLAVASQLSSAAVDAYLVIKGSKQGQFKGEGTSASGGKIHVEDFNFGVIAPRDQSSGMATGREAQSPKATGQAVTAPRDQATGQASGKRQHGTITIIKEWGASSPQLKQAMDTGEVLLSVDIEFVHPGARGPEVYKTIHMTNVMVSSITQSATSGAGSGKKEIVKFDAETESIQMMSKDGKKMAMDDWMASK